MNDTIVAISSVIAAAARGIVRLSGPRSFEIAAAVAEIPVDAGVRRIRVRWLDQSVPGWAYAFIAPRSATGEDVVELHLPGNPVILRATLKSLISAGARPAEPGEFTARAYFNGRIDLTQAEGVAATIAAANEAELRAARRLLSGELARRLRPPMDALAETLALIEAGIDFSEEDVSFLSPDQLLERVRAIDGELDRLNAESRRFAGLVHEPTVALVGRPNAGKSTLLNALSGQARAVVSPVAGTTRDVIWAHVPLRRGLIRLIDAAGVEQQVAEPNKTVAGQILRQMQDRSIRSVTSADVVVLVRDARDANPPPPLPRAPDLVVRTKADLVAGPSAADLTVSAVSGAGMDELRERLDQLAFGTAVVGASLALNDRHLTAITAARDALGRVAVRPGATGEIVALELREALDSLGTVLGQITPDDVLGRVFATFCIGK